MTTPASTSRARWMSVLARAPGKSLERRFAAEVVPPPYELLRAPETGLVMVRGRAGGTGAPFNVGETTVTRCAVRLADGTLGHAYVMGTDKRHAEIAAVCDALLQTPDQRERLQAALIAPLAAEIETERLQAARHSAATRVEFFTMVRGDD